MAQRKPVVIDDDLFYADPRARIIDLVPEDVQSITTRDGAVISRSAFARTPLPDGFETNLSAINKGVCPGAA